MFDFNISKEAMKVKRSPQIKDAAGDSEGQQCFCFNFSTYRLEVSAGLLPVVSHSATTCNIPFFFPSARGFPTEW